GFGRPPLGNRLESSLGSQGIRVPVGLLAQRVKRVLRCLLYECAGRTDADRAAGGQRLREGAGRPADVLLDRPLLRPEQFAPEPGFASLLETQSNRVSRRRSPSP